MLKCNIFKYKAYMTMQIIALAELLEFYYTQQGWLFTF